MSAVVNYARGIDQWMRDGGTFEIARRMDIGAGRVGSSQ